MKPKHVVALALAAVAASSAAAVVFLSAPSARPEYVPPAAGRNDSDMLRTKAATDTRAVAKAEFSDSESKAVEQTPTLAINVLGPDKSRPEGLVMIRALPDSELAASQPVARRVVQYSVAANGSTIVIRPVEAAEIVVECPGFEAVILDFPAADVSTLDVVLRQELVVRGIVVDGSDDTPVAGAEVSAWPVGVTPTPADLSPPAGAVGRTLRRAISDEQGRFEIRALSPSSVHQLRAYKPGWIAPSALRVGDGARDRSLTIRLAPLYAAVAVFNDQDGVPIRADEALASALWSQPPEGFVLVDDTRSDVRLALPPEYARATAGRLSFLECYVEESGTRSKGRLDFSADVLGFARLENAEIPLTQVAEGTAISQLRLQRLGLRGTTRLRVTFPHTPIANCDASVGRLVVRSALQDREVMIGLRRMRDRTCEVNGLPCGRLAVRYFSEGNLLVWPPPDDPPLQIDAATGGIYDVVVAIRDVAALRWRAVGGPRVQSRLDVTMIEPRRGAGATHSFDGVDIVVPLFPPSRFDATLGLRDAGNAPLATLKDVEAFAGRVVDLDSVR